MYTMCLVTVRNGLYSGILERVGGINSKCGPCATFGMQRHNPKIVYYTHLGKNPDIRVYLSEPQKSGYQPDKCISLSHSGGLQGVVYVNVLCSNKGL